MSWDVETLKEHFEALRAADQRAIQIKETGDAKALSLAREIQTYKDEKANELREQISSERGIYATKAEIKPLADYITAQQGQAKGSDITMAKIVTTISVVGAILGIIVLLANGVFK